MTKLKFCGIKTIEIATLICNYPVDYIGFIIDYPPSPRNVSAIEAKKIIEELQQKFSILPTFIGVFVNQPINEVINTAHYCNFPIIQLHGQETIEDCQRAKYDNLKVWKSLSISTAKDLEPIENYAPSIDVLHLDSQIPGSPSGGQGKTFDWQLAIQAKQSFPKICLSGGITIKNIEKALLEVQPDIIDLSSGIEKQKGIKSPTKIKNFMNKWQTINT